MNNTSINSYYLSTPRIKKQLKQDKNNLFSWIEYTCQKVDILVQLEKHIIIP